MNRNNKSVSFIRKKRTKRKDLRRFFDAIPFPLVVTVPESGQLLDANLSAIEFFQFPPYWRQHMDMKQYYKEGEERAKIIRILEAGGQIRDLPEEIQIEDRTLYVRVHYSLIKMYGQKLLLTGLTDVTDEFMMQEQLNFMASTDELTGLYNRRKAFELLEERYVLSRIDQTSFDISFLDVNGLKRTNDQFGHKVGDAIIRTCADLLKQTSCPDCQLSRLGGDEFMVVHPIGKSNAGCRFKEALEINIETFNQLNRLPLVSLSHGIAVFDPAKQETISQLVDRADGDMYRNKHGSSNKHFRSDDLL